MGFSNTGSFGTAASKHRQAEIPSVHVCVHCDCAPICACDVHFLVDEPTAGPDEVHFKSFPWRYHHTESWRSKHAWMISNNRKCASEETTRQMSMTGCHRGWCGEKECVMHVYLHPKIWIKHTHESWSAEILMGSGRYLLLRWCARQHIYCLSNNIPDEHMLLAADFIMLVGNGMWTCYLPQNHSAFHFTPFALADHNFFFLLPQPLPAATDWYASSKRPIRQRMLRLLLSGILLDSQPS